MRRRPQPTANAERQHTLRQALMNVESFPAGLFQIDFLDETSSVLRYQLRERVWETVSTGRWTQADVEDLHANDLIEVSHRGRLGYTFTVLKEDW